MAMRASPASSTDKMTIRWTATLQPGSAALKIVSLAVVWPSTPRPNLYHSVRPETAVMQPAANVRRTMGEQVVKKRTPWPQDGRHRQHRRARRHLDF